jgi:hypothetical protein
MEVWIFHSCREWVENSKREARTSQAYSVWATEKQAVKAAANYLQSEITDPDGGAFYDDYALWAAIKCLIADEHYEEAIRLTNDYSQAEPPKYGGVKSSHKIRIIIAKSTFKGFAFE